MKKIIALFLLTTIYSFAQTFDINLSLNAHNDSIYGQWKLEQTPNNKLDALYHGNILPSSHPSPYYVDGTGIDVFDKELYLNQFLKNGYYHLEWIANKNTITDNIWEVNEQTKEMIKESDFFKNYHDQEGSEEMDWSMVLSDYINHTIGTIPSYELTLHNNTKHSINILEFYTKTIFTIGSEASPGGAYLPTQSQENFFSLEWQKENKLTLQKAVTLQTNGTATIPINIFVKNGAQGDGPGQLTVALFVKYQEGKTVKEELLTMLNQSEDYGYMTGW